MTETDEIRDLLSHLLERIPCRDTHATDIVNRIIDQLNAIDKKPDAVKLLESLTPGGSEFHDDPERCVEYIKAQRKGAQDALIQKGLYVALLQQALDIGKTSVGSDKVAAWIADAKLTLSLDRDVATQHTKPKGMCTKCNGLMYDKEYGYHPECEPDQNKGENIE